MNDKRCDMFVGSMYSPYNTTQCRQSLTVCERAMNTRESATLRSFTKAVG